VLPQDPTVCRTSKLYIFAGFTLIEKKVEQTLHNPSETAAALAGPPRLGDTVS
jgi:hypothetical protein